MDGEAGIVAQNEAGRRLFGEGRFDEGREAFMRVASDPAALGAAINVGQCDLPTGRSSGGELRISPEPDAPKIWRVAH